MLAAVAWCDGGGGSNNSRQFGQEQRDCAVNHGS